MSKNPLYSNEITTANMFILDHKSDTALMALLKSLQDPMFIHSDRWSILYDYISSNYPEYTNIITGLSYWCEP